MTEAYSKTRHGEACRGQQSSLYRAWANMKVRCTHKSREDYKHYGGRGILVCDEWSNFEAFRVWAYANGYKPNLSLERVNNNGDYCPENCKWVTHKEQMRNTRRNRLLTAFGETKPLIEWIEDTRCTVKYETVRMRLYRGWTVEEAIGFGPKQRRRE